jgi:class 3 adenylate cyclase
MKTANAAATLASVVFLKIQEFARRPVQEQARLRAQLEAVVAVTTAELAPASRIVLDAADGAAIVVLGDPKGALRLAERALAATAAGLPLCVGVNHGAVQLAGGRDGDGLIGDGIAVAASVAEFASPSRLLMSRSFRDAMADASPGLESGLFPAGVFTDAGLRTHELFSPDGRVAERRRTRFFALSVAAVIGLIGAGVAARVSAEGHQKFVEGVVIKIRQTIAQGERVLGGVIEKVRWQKRS